MIGVEGKTEKGNFLSACGVEMEAIDNGNEGYLYSCAKDLIPRVEGL
jgi:hypothetical protein